MELRIFVIGESIGWKTLLNQIGITYSIINEEEFVDTKNIPLLIISKMDSLKSKENILKYINSGGNVICSSEIFSNIIGENNKKVFIKYLIPADSGPFSDSELIDIYNKSYISEYSNYLLTDRKTNSLQIKKYGEGNVCILPFDAGQLISKLSSKKKSFYTQGRRLPYENVSLVSKGSVRRLIFNCIDYLLRTSGYDFKHLWYFPKNYSNIFMLRVDTDFGNESQVDALYKLSLKYKIPITWFVNTKSQEDWIKKYVEMENQEIGVHCYEHQVYDSYAQNYSNIKKGLDVLKNICLSPKGFAAPYGQWNQGLGQAIRDLNFSYSSELSFDYDNLPSFTSFKTLQIPIHPICIGSLRRQGYKGSEMIKYFYNEIDNKIHLYEPIIFYHHPNHEHFDVVESIFQKINELNIPSFKFIDYVKWWNERQNQQEKVNISFANEDFYFRIINVEGKEGFCTISDNMKTNDISWSEKLKPIPPPKDIARIRKKNIWMYINKIEDYIHR